MSDGIKRFFKQADVTERDGGFGLTLDGRNYKTPAESPFVLPTAAMAEAVAAEWNAAEDKIFPERMPITTHANTAIDRVSPQRADVIAEMAGYAGTELLCYRAEDPAALVDRQRQEWDPLLDWARKTHNLHFELAAGILHVAQPDSTLAQAKKLLTAMNDFELAAVFTLITATGSYTAGLAVHARHLSAAEAFQITHLDELYQAEVWGTDEEAEDRRQGIITALEKAAEFLTFCH